MFKIIPEKLSPCVQGVPCSVDYINWLGFITIPLLSFFAYTIVLILLIILLTFILINILLKQSINDKFFDIAIYKSIGYKDKYIFQLLFYELFLITTLSYLFSIVPSFIGINSINLIFSKFNIHNNFINIMCVYLAPLINIYFIIYISSFLYSISN